MSLRSVLTIFVGWIPEILDETSKNGMKKTGYVIIMLMFGIVGFGAYSVVSFAKASDVQGIKSDVSQVRESLDLLLEIQIASSIRDTKRRLCGSTDAADRNFLNQELDRKLRQYARLTKEHYRVPACDEL